MPGYPSKQEILDAIERIGAQQGLNGEQIKTAQAVALSEAGWDGQVGDGGTSFGPFQFHIGGMLNGFADWLGQTLQQAGETAREDPNLAVTFALEPGGYLSGAIKDGWNKGLRGPDLAYYASKFGQVSANPQGAANAWALLTGQDTPPDPNPSPSPSPSPFPFPIPIQIPGIQLPGIQLPTPTLPNPVSDITSAVAAIPQAISDGIRSVERFFWIAVGVVVVLAGIMLLVQSNREVRDAERTAAIASV